MRIPKIIFASLSVAVLCISSATVTHADTLTFTGSVDTSNNPPAAPNVGRCGAPAPPNLLVSLNPGSGISNLGSFTQTLSHCINVATGNISNGLFTFDFGGGNTFFGTMAGTITLPPVGGVAPFAETFTLTGGTGLFGGASGTLIASGTVTFNPSGTTNTHADFNGTINTVPEPTTLLLLGTGLAGVGAAVRKRRKSRRDEAL
jgi:hypothetical protein